MGLQLIIVVEANKKCKSDWIYIKDTIDRFYRYEQAHVKFSPVYMDGKGNYKRKQREVSELISQYAAASKTNQSEVLYCFDCDDYDVKSEDLDFLKSAQQYCNEQEYDFIWFCKDIESVYLGRKVDDGQKKKESSIFKAKKMIKDVDERKLLASTYRTNTSNIMNILDNYLKRKES